MSRLSPESRRWMLDHLDACMRYWFPLWKPDPFHLAICKVFDRVSLGDLSRVILTVPPQHGKSTIASIGQPLRQLARDPDSTTAITGHTEGLVNRFSRQVRDVVNERRWRDVAGPLVIRRDASAVREWRLKSHKGGMVARSVKAGLSGTPVTHLIVDDPIADAEEAANPETLDAIWRWFGTVALARKPKTVSIIATRWAEDDLTGRITKKALDDPSFRAYHHLHLPAWEDGRGWLWPHYGIDLYEETKSILGPEFELVFNGNPVPDAGDFFERAWFGASQYLANTPTLRRLVRVFDIAASNRESADETATVLGGPYGEKKVAVLEADTWKLRWPQNKAHMIDIITRDRLYAASIGATYEVAMSRAGIGAIGMDDLRDSVRAVTFTEFPEVKDKVFRANIWRYRAKAGQVFFVIGAGSEKVIEQAIKFPRGKHKDLVDCMTGLHDVLLRDDRGARTGGAAAKAGTLGALGLNPVLASQLGMSPQGRKGRQPRG